MAKYKEQYWEMEYIWRNNTEKLKELEELRKHADTIHANFIQNMDYIPPVLKADAFPIQYRDHIMEATQIPSASINNYDISLTNNHPVTVHVPQLPPIQQYYNIGGPIDNTRLYQNLNQTYAAMDTRHQTFEANFRNDMNRMN